MNKEFDNIDRNRYYGLRKGDLVFLGFKSQSPRKLAEVIEYGFMDNNRVRVKTEDGEECNYVAEHCEILLKVEDRESIKRISDPKCKVGDRIYWLTVRDEKFEGQIIAYEKGEWTVKADNGKTIYFEI